MLKGISNFQTENVIKKSMMEIGIMTLLEYFQQTGRANLSTLNR